MAVRLDSSLRHSEDSLAALLKGTPRWASVGSLITLAAAINVLLAVGVAVGHKPLLLTAALGLLPAALIAFGTLIQSQRAVLAWIALFTDFTGLRFLGDRLPVPGGTSIYLTDVLLLLAVGAWLAGRLSQRRAERVQLSIIFTWPLALFAVTLLVAVLRGHERYGASLVGQPARLVLYAGIALALTDTTPDAAWRAITRVFYAGAVIQTAWAAYYLATGASATQSSVLSTGGTRVLALSVAIYLTGSLICALLNLEREKSPTRQLGHAAIAGLALFGIIVSFGRTTYAAVVLIVPLLLLTRRYMRRSLFLILPLIAPLLILLVLIVPTVKPNLYPMVKERISGTSSSDLNIRWREEAINVTLRGVSEEPLTGVGFGRTGRFELEGRVYTITDDPHNSYVWLLAGGGLLALGSFVLLCLLYAVDAVKRLRGASDVEQALIVWALGTWFAFMVNALAGPIFSNQNMLMTVWIMFSLPSLVLFKVCSKGSPI